MLKNTTSLLLATVIALGVSGCESSPERDNTAERAGASAGRVIDDSVITGKVKTALVADPDTKAHQINVETFKGTVQLSGFVDDTTARRRATEVARTVDGVKNVENELEVRSRNN
jgi:osmotically-inducible protein OsmY